MACRAASGSFFSQSVHNQDVDAQGRSTAPLTLKSGQSALAQYIMNTFQHLDNDGVLRGLQDKGETQNLNPNPLVRKLAFALARIPRA
jgi:hypothetical protein